MANLERENPIGIVDARRSTATVEKTGDGTLNNDTNSVTYNNVGQLRTTLAASSAHGAGFYTSARLDNMTKNDMVYALRLINDAAGIK